MSSTVHSCCKQLAGVDDFLHRSSAGCSEITEFGWPNGGRCQVCIFTPPLGISSFPHPPPLRAFLRPVELGEGRENTRRDFSRFCSLPCRAPSQLRSVNLAQCRRLNDAALASLLASCSQLTSLDISFCGGKRGLTAAGCAAALAAAPATLRGVDSSGSKVWFTSPNHTLPLPHACGMVALGFPDPPGANVANSRNSITHRPLFFCRPLQARPLPPSRARLRALTLPLSALRCATTSRVTLPALSHLTATLPSLRSCRWCSMRPPWKTRSRAREREQETDRREGGTWAAQSACSRTWMMCGCFTRLHLRHMHMLFRPYSAPTPAACCPPTLVFASCSPRLP